MLTFDETHCPEHAPLRKKPLVHDGAGIAGQLSQLADSMALINDIAGNLENACGWYDIDDADLPWGGPPSKQSLATNAEFLRTAYMNIALATGLDPCEQLPATKELLARERAAQLTRP